MTDDYILSHITPEHPYLADLYRQTNTRLLAGRMASGHLQGLLLRMIVCMLKPRHILEMGTFSGYSALSMASALEGDGHLWTFEIDDELEDFTRPWIERSPWASRITFSIGDAITEAPKLGMEFDLVFIDGDKRHYAEAYEASLRMTRSGSFILADNTLWDGHVTDPAYDRDRQTLGIRRFNDLVASDPRAEKLILPLRDGMTIVRVV